MGGGGVGSGGGGVRVDGNRELKLINVKIQKKKYFFFWGGGRGHRVGGFRVDVKRRSKVFVRINKKNFEGGGSG